MKFSLSILLALISSIALAGNNNPPTPHRGPAPPPGLPIDTHIFVLIGIAILLLIFLSKKFGNHKIKKSTF